MRKEPHLTDDKQLRQPLGSHSSLSAHRQGFSLFVGIEGNAIKAKHAISAVPAPRREENAAGLDH